MGHGHSTTATPKRSFRHFSELLSNQGANEVRSKFHIQDIVVTCVQLTFSFS